MVIVPNSYGSQPLQEMWSDAARASSISTRAGRATGGKDLWKTKKKGGAGPAKPKKPTQDKEDTNEKGEKVASYSDGSTLTKHGDGTATHRSADGVERKGKFKEPAKKDDPEGFRANTPESDAADAKRATADTERKARKADVEKRRAETDARKEKAYRSKARVIGRGGSKTVGPRAKKPSLSKRAL